MQNQSLIKKLRLTCLSTFAWAMIFIGTAIGFVIYLKDIDSIPYVAKWDIVWFIVFLFDQILVKPLWERRKVLRNLKVKLRLLTRAASCEASKALPHED
jgi:hypothetical protein